MLVTGATGFIGRQVMRHLLAGGRSVIAMARSRENLSARASCGLLAACLTDASWKLSTPI
jgi:uncharacterized protein YbjT (DUF2867 family)